MTTRFVLQRDICTKTRPPPERSDSISGRRKKRRERVFSHVRAAGESEDERQSIALVMIANDYENSIIMGSYLRLLNEVSKQIFVDELFKESNIKQLH